MSSSVLSDIKIRGEAEYPLGLIKHALRMFQIASKTIDPYLVSSLAK